MSTQKTDLLPPPLFIRVRIQLQYDPKSLIFYILNISKIYIHKRRQNLLLRCFIELYRPFWRSSIFHLQTQIYLFILILCYFRAYCMSYPCQWGFWYLFCSGLTWIIFLPVWILGLIGTCRGRSICMLEQIASKIEVGTEEVISEVPIEVQG